MSDFSLELKLAIDAVRSASRVCRAVQARLVSAETLEKKDKSPVTVADFASQAIICQRLQAALPVDLVVGEEDSAELREEGQEALRAAIALEVGREVDEAVSEDTVLGWIDRGSAQADTHRYWTLDPIDGTKGFLRGEQYAVALALIENRRVVLGVLGCPNLEGAAGAGLLFSAVQGGGAYEHALDGDGDGGRIRVAPISKPSEARFCESVESAHSDQSESAQIADRLGITGEPFRIDSQCKYAAVARGDASIYLRMPTRADYREKIWDHAAGKLVVEEAGGRVTDVFGNDLDFTHGRTLEENRGIVATSGAIHDEVIAAVRAVRGQ